ncbi:MAG: hypothetical protein WB523_23170 [Candidatus Sulfotelmatobacter sp.]
MRELRSAVMILVEASWEDESGAVKAIPARMEDRSASGACIRVKTPIGVGEKLRIQWRFDQFSGVTKYCRSDGREFLVGILRDKSSTPDPPAKTEMPLLTGKKEPTQPPRAAEIESLLVKEKQPREISATAAKVQREPAIVIARSGHLLATGMGEMESRHKLRISRLQGSKVLRRTEVRAKQPSREREGGKERKPMKRKWLELASWRSKQEGLSVSGEVSGEAAGGGESKGERGREVAGPRISWSAAKSAADMKEGVASVPVELSPIEDIYAVAGIANPRGGYSVNKVVDMLHSEHIRGLSAEMKRAAVLMALDAAGVTIGQIQQDAKTRQSALDAYEAEQRKQAEEEWARKAEENIQIQSELERVKAQYMARIARNEEGVAREKAKFETWQAAKKQASANMTEVVDLCLKRTAAEQPDSPMLAKAAAVGSGVKPV